jgi:hypothetical protein
MVATCRDDMLRRALLGLWVEPWREADSAWCGTGVWPAWLDWVFQNRPELLSGLWADWCDAVGTVPGAGLEHWLNLGAPVDGVWRDVARLSSLSADGLERVLATCGAVSVFSRADAGVLWVQSQSQGREPKNAAWRQCMMAGWRLSRLCRLAPAKGAPDGWMSQAAYVHQGVRVLLSGAYAEWREVWALVWPHWRWRLAPVWAQAVCVDVRQATQVPVMPWDSGGFSRVWAQAMLREVGP